MPEKSKPLVITNFGGGLTRRNVGDINSGKTKFETSWGYDPFSKPGNLTWLEQPTSIYTWGASPVGPMMAMRQRTEGSSNNVYGIDVGDRLYEIDVNNSTNPDLDSVNTVGSLIAANYDRGGYLTFYGSTEKVFVTNDDNIQKINFNGTSASVIGLFTNDVPHPLAQFLGKIYFGNSNNIGEVDSTEVVTSVGKLDPALPSGLIVRDLDITPDGNYLQITASRNNVPTPYGGAQDTYSSSAADSYKFYWNGINPSYTTLESYSGLVLASNVIQGNENYTFGYDTNGAAIFLGPTKVVSLPKVITPNPNAVFSNGNMLGFATTDYEDSSDQFRTAIYSYGQYDEEISKGLFRLLRQGALIEDEVMAVSACVPVSNKIYAASVWGTISDNIVGTAKIYYSTQERDTGGNTTNKLWRFFPSPRGNRSILAGIYETQTQLFSKKTAVKEVRIYTEPLVGGNDFIVDLIGSGGSVMAGGSQRFQVATGSVATGTDMVQFNPAMAPTYALGLRITNSSVTGVAQWTALKAEVDIVEGGK